MATDRGVELRVCPEESIGKIGIEVSDSTIRRYRPPRVGPPSQSWRSFLDNHLADPAAMDFFIVPTVTFRVLYVLLTMSHDRRRILQFSFTTSPSPRWTAQQVVEAFPNQTRPRFLLRDRDRTVGSTFVRRVGATGIEEVATATGSPWQNDCPDPRPVEPPRLGDVVVYPQVGGLHHRYGRRFAA